MTAERVWRCYFNLLVNTTVWRLSSVQHFGLESKPAPAFAFLSWWVFKVCRIKFICLHKLNINYYNVFLHCVLRCPGERGRVFGVREAETRRMEGWTFWDDIKHRLDRRPDVDEPGLGFIVCFMLVSCAPHRPDFPSTHLCPIRLISPALHLHCTSFTGLSSSSSTSLLLVFFCSFPSPVSLHLHSSPSWGLFVCQLVLLARSLSVRLFSSHPLVPPVILRPSCVPLFVLCFCCTVCLNSLHLSAFCDPSAYLLLDFASFWLHTNDTRTHTSFLSLHLAPVWM